MKKYELLTEPRKITEGGVVYQIKALRDFGDVEAGDLGGWIDESSTLDHESDSWIYDNSMVFDGSTINSGSIIKNATGISDSVISGTILIGCDIKEKSTIINSSLIFCTMVNSYALGSTLDDCFCTDSSVGHDTTINGSEVNFSTVMEQCHLSSCTINTSIIDSRSVIHSQIIDSAGTE